MKVNWWLIGALEFVLLLLILAGYGLFYLSSSNKLPAGRIKEKLSEIEKKEDDKFTLEGVKVEINRIGYDKFLSTIIGNIGDIEEITIAEFSGIYTTYKPDGEEQQQLYILSGGDDSQQVIVVTVTSEEVTREDVTEVVESFELLPGV